MLFDLYCIIYLIKIDRIHVYDCAIKRLKHYFPTNAHCKLKVPQVLKAVKWLRAFMVLGLNLRVHLSESQVLTSN